MSHIAQLISLKEHLERRYHLLMERSIAYRFIDEEISDRAAFKAMKISKKLDQIAYLNNDLFQSAS
jgi:hypothetical protein